MPCKKPGPFYRFKVHSDANEKQLREVSAKDIWGGFKEQTTAHGVPHVDQARGYCKIVFWTLISLACCGVLIWQLTSLVQYFRSRPIDVVIALAHKTELRFPSVTICNLNPIKYSMLNYSSELEEHVTSNRTSRRRRDLRNLGDSDVYRRVRRSSSDISDKGLEIMAAIDEDTKPLMGYTRDEFIIDCQYAGSDCNMDEFATYFDPTYGNCYLFNSGWLSGVEVKKSKRAGRRHGMKFVLNIQQDEYVEELSQGAGARILINSQKRMPFPSDEGILTTPGQITSIGMRRVFITRLGEPHGNCTTAKNTDSKRNVYEEHYNVKYSSNACYKTCYQKYVIRDCGCADPQFPTYGDAFGRSSPAPICRSGDEDESACMDRVSSKHQDNKLNCKCPTQCKETAYNFEVSNVQWPSDVHMQSVIDTYASVAPEVANANDSIEALNNNLLKVEVYYQEFNYETMTEREGYRDFNFFSDIGGILGLYLGLSLLSIFEFFELGFDLFILLCMKCCRKNDQVSESPPPPYSSENGHTNRNMHSTSLADNYNDDDDVFAKPKSHNMLGFV